MKKQKKQLAKIAREAIDAYVGLIANVDAMFIPALRERLETERLLKEATDMSIRLEKLRERDV